MPSPAIEDTRDQEADGNGSRGIRVPEPIGHRGFPQPHKDVRLRGLCIVVQTCAHGRRLRLGRLLFHSQPQMAPSTRPMGWG